MPTKVLFTITKSNLGGAQRYVYDLATNLPADQYEVIVALGGDGPLKKRLEGSHLRVIDVPEWQRDIVFAKDIRSFFTMLHTLRSEKPDIVHANSSKAGGITALAARVVGIKKIVFTAHGWPFNDPVGPLNRMLRWFFSWLTALLSHDVITVSENNLKQGIRMPFAKNKMRMIHNGVPTYIGPGRNTTRKNLFEKLSLSQDDADKIFMVGAVSEMNKNKNLGSAIRAIAESRAQCPNKDVRLCIMGDGEERSALTELVHALGLEDAVYMPGALSGIDYMPGLDVFVMPSKKEGLPYAILEAGSIGLPVIASPVGGIPEIIKSGDSGVLVSPNDNSTLARILCDLSQDPNKCRALGAALKSDVEKRFSLAQMLQNTITIYRTN